ncbi:MAG: glycosyltransferase family 2 protein [Planctomycetota bacterium]
MAVIVTWNRRADVLRVLDRLSSMDTGGAALHAIVVDNASTDGTAEAVAEFAAERAWVDGAVRVVRHDENLGGCGGFNGGFAAVERDFGPPGSEGGPDFVWLLDDDIDLPSDALLRLMRAAKPDPRIALVGSRTVDLGDRRTTIESTIFYDRSAGMMGPGERGESLREAVEGVRDVDIVSACSMLVRWAAIEGVGYWDDRFFIYCDDADWCLRVKRAGWRVVCALDAVVYHTPWTHKLTPVRAYYLHRNLLWMNAKHLEGAALRRVWLRWCWRLLREAKSAALNRRMTDAVLRVRAVVDAVSGRGGKLHFEMEREPLLDALTRAGAMRGDVVVVASGRPSFDASERVRAEVANGLISAGRAGEMPRWRTVLRHGEGDAEHGGDAPIAGDGRVPIVRFHPTRFGKLAAQRFFVRRRPDVVIVIDGECGFPLLLGRTTLHVSADDVSSATVEPGGLGAVVSFAWSWAGALVRAMAHGLTIRRDTRSDPAASQGAGV